MRFGGRPPFIRSAKLHSYTFVCLPYHPSIHPVVTTAAWYCCHSVYYRRTWSSRRVASFSTELPTILTLIREALSLLLLQHTHVLLAAAAWAWSAFAASNGSTVARYLHYGSDVRVNGLFAIAGQRRLCGIKVKRQFLAKVSSAIIVSLKSHFVIVKLHNKLLGRNKRLLWITESPYLPVLQIHNFDLIVQVETSSIPPGTHYSIVS